jgi:hypothetical protein
MKAYKLSLALLVLPLLYAAPVQASSASGTMHFTGWVYQPASASMNFHTHQTDASVAAKQTDSLQAFRQAWPCEILEYFETYAAKDAKVVSVTYL